MAGSCGPSCTTSNDTNPGDPSAPACRISDFRLRILGLKVFLCCPSRTCLQRCKVRHAQRPCAPGFKALAASLRGLFMHHVRRHKARQPDRTALPLLGCPPFLQWNHTYIHSGQAHQEEEHSRAHKCHAVMLVQDGHAEVDQPGGRITVDPERPRKADTKTPNAHPRRACRACTGWTCPGR